MTIVHPFEAGGRYRNRTGPYEVLSIEGEHMRIRYDSGQEQMVTIAHQARIWQSIQDEFAPPPPAPGRFPSDDEGLDTQPVGDLVHTVLRAKFTYPYPEDITDQLCLAIENNPDWLARYDNLVMHFSSGGKLGKLTVNSSIGRYTKKLTGMETLIDVLPVPARSKLIGNYSRLRAPGSAGTRSATR